MHTITPTDPARTTPLFPHRYLSLLLGEVASAKSLTAIHLVARASRDIPLPSAPFLPTITLPPQPFEPRLPIPVLASLEEDDLTLTLRLKAAGADLDRVHILANPSLVPPTPGENSPTPRLPPRPRPHRPHLLDRPRPPPRLPQTSKEGQELRSRFHLPK